MGLWWPPAATQIRLDAPPKARRYVYLIIQCGASLAEATAGEPSAPCTNMYIYIYNPHPHAHARCPGQGAILPNEVKMRMKRDEGEMNMKMK